METDLLMLQANENLFQLLNISMENDLKMLLGKRKLAGAVPMLERMGVYGLETLGLLEDADIDLMVDNVKYGQRVWHDQEKEIWNKGLQLQIWSREVVCHPNLQLQSAHSIGQIERHSNPFYRYRVVQNGLPPMTGRLLKKELPSLVSELTALKQKSDVTAQKSDDELVRDILKMLPNDATEKKREIVNYFERVCVEFSFLHPEKRMASDEYEKISDDVESYLSKQNAYEMGFLKMLLEERKFSGIAVNILSRIGVFGLETLELLEDADIDVMVENEKYGLPLVTGRLLKKELPFLVSTLRYKCDEAAQKSEDELEKDILKMLPSDIQPQVYWSWSTSCACSVSWRRIQSSIDADRAKKRAEEREREEREAERNRRLGYDCDSY